MKGAANKTFWIITYPARPKPFILAASPMIYHHGPLFKKKRQTAFQNCISACVSFSPSVRPLASLSPPSNGGCCDAKCHSPPRAPGPMCEVCDRWSSFSKLCPGHFGCIRPTSFTLQVYVFNLTSKRVKVRLEDG